MQTRAELLFSEYRPFCTNCICLWKCLFGSNMVRQVKAINFYLIMKKNDIDKIYKNIGQLLSFYPIWEQSSWKEPDSFWNRRQWHTGWSIKEAGDKNNSDKTVHFNYAAIKSQSKAYYTPLTFSVLWFQLQLWAPAWALHTLMSPVWTAFSCKLQLIFYCLCNSIWIQHHFLSHLH